MNGIARRSTVCRMSGHERSFDDVRYRGSCWGSRRLLLTLNLQRVATCPSASPIRASLQSGSTGTTSMPETPPSDDHRSIASLASSLT